VPDDPFWRLIGEATGDAGACAASATARVATRRDEEMLEQVRSEGAQDGVGLAIRFIEEIDFDYAADDATAVLPTPAVVPG
jgi:hypothetical protein